MVRLLLPAALILSLVEVATAQINRRSREEPEMTIEAGGRTGTCDFLGFSSDGRYLYAAGDDKVVHVWPAGADGLQTGRRETLRWPGWRDQRGGIKTLALPRNAGDRRVGIAGYGMKNGLVTLLDSKGEVEAVNDILDVDMPATNVMASAFDPKGKFIVYGSAEGILWCWDFNATNKPIDWNEVIKAGDKLLPNRPRLIRFLDENTFICAWESGAVRKLTRAGDKWNSDRLFSAIDRLHEFFKAKREAGPAHALSMYRADVSADGKLLACSLQPKFLAVCPLDGSAANVIRVGDGVRSLAFDPDGRLAVASISHNQKQQNGQKFMVDGDDSILIYANPTVANPKPVITLNHSFRAEAMAWNKQHGYLAVAGGDNHEITLWNPTKPQAPMQVVRGRGRGLWSVRVGADGESIQFQSARDADSPDPNARGKGEWHTFNFVSGTRVEGKEGVTPRLTADGWSIEPTNKSWIWQAVLREGGEVIRHDLTIDLGRDEQPRCYCFLPKTATQPTRVLVGHYHGYTLFELTPKAATPVALTTGHWGDVTSIAVDAKNSWVVTGGLDQTIAGWSVDPWPNGRFGAALQKVEGKLLVESVDIGGPAWEMGLSKGDEIILLIKGGITPAVYALPGKYGDNMKKKYEPNEPVGSVDDALAALTRPTPGIEHYMAWRKPNTKRHTEGLSTVRQRPLWKFFPSFDANNHFDQWVAWMWKTGHYATSTHGDRLVGWQLNDADTIIRKKPEFYEAERFKEQRHDRITVLRLMLTRDFAAAYQEVSGENRKDLNLGDLEPGRVQLSVGGAVVGKNGLDLGIRVAGHGTNPDNLPERVELWVNDYRVKTWNANHKTFSTSEAIPESVFRNGENQVTVLTFNSAGGRGEEKSIVASNRKESEPRVLALLVGIDDYSQTAAKSDGTREFGRLTSAVNDAEKLNKAWEAQAAKGKLYSGERRILRVDRNAQPEEILKQLDILVKEAKTDDRVIVFLAGHGDFLDVPKAKKGSDDKMFVYCGPQYDRTKYQTTGLTGDEIFKRLADCPARKVVLIDACHSGNATSEGVIRRLVPAGQGPVVIAACDQAERSYEDPDVKHGLFTKAVLEALGDQLAIADGNDDKKLDPQELYDYVTGRLPRLLKASGKSSESQHPQIFPLEPGRFAIAQK
jgi:WD40 repeat protein